MGDLASTQCDIELARKPAIKLPPGPPHILICIPVGTKGEKLSFKVPKAGERVEGGCTDSQCSCSNHGKVLTTEVRTNLLVPSHWALSFTNLVAPLNTRVGSLIESGHLSSQSRDKMTKKAIQLDAKYIFYWDDDVILPPLALYTLYNTLERYPDIGLVTGVYCTREDPTEPFVYREHGRGAWWDFSIDPADPPQDIFSAGGGCLLTRVEAIKKMTPPYWADEQVFRDDKESASHWGHDVRFIKNLREQSGFRTCVVGSVLCGHWDNDKQKMFELPEDSPPYQRLEKKKKGVLPEMIKIAAMKRLPDDWFIDYQLSGHRHRLFSVMREHQSQEEFSSLLQQGFEKVSVYPLEDRWVALCEGARNGIRDASGSRSRQHGNVGGDSGERGSPVAQPSGEESNWISTRPDLRLDPR